VQTVLQSYETISNSLFAPGTEEFIHGLRFSTPLPRMAGSTTVICGNLARLLPGFKDHTLYTIKGKKILVTSLLDPTVADSPVAGISIIPPETALKKQLAIPHDLAIVVFHLPDNKAREVIGQTPGLDIAILAEQRGVFSQPEQRNGCFLVKCNDRGRSLGWLDWNLQTHTLEKLRIIEIKPRLYRPDPKVQLLVSNYEKWRDQRYFAIKKKQREKERSVRNNK